MMKRKLAWQSWPESSTSICDTIVEGSSTAVLDQDYSQQSNIDCDPDTVDDHGTSTMI